MNAVAQITIVMDDAGMIHVSGQIDNKVAAYGMLAAAKDAIHDYIKKKQEGGGIITPPVGYALPKT